MGDREELGKLSATGGDFSPNTPSITTTSFAFFFFFFFCPHSTAEPRETLFSFFAFLSRNSSSSLAEERERDSEKMESEIWYWKKGGCSKALT